MNNSFQSSQKPSFSQSGITVFELLAVVCIIGVLTSIGTVTLRPLWLKHQLEVTVKSIEEQIQLLRMKAIIEKTTYEMKIDNSGLEYRKSVGKNWGDWRKFSLREKCNISMSGSIYFDQKGFTSPKTITVRFNGMLQQIIININGRIRKSEVL